MREQIRESNAEQQMDAPTRNRLGKIWYLIGLAWQCGDVLDENERLAIDSFRRAAGYGNTEAMRCLADICIYRDKDLMKALDWLILANENDVSSGKQEDTESETVRRYREAAERGSAGAQVRLGECFVPGTRHEAEPERRHQMVSTGRKSEQCKGDALPWYLLPFRGLR